MNTPGLVFATGLGEGSIQRVRTFAPMAEARGFRNFLMTEQVSDALALAQYAASVTKRIHIGTAVTNIYLRPALAVAFQALTIDTATPGRLLLGLGTSHAIINHAYGIAMEKPLTLLRSYVETLQGVFNGKHPGLKQLAALGLPLPHATHHIPLFVGGVSPKSIQLAGEVADGIVPTPYGVRMLREVIEGVAEGARRVGRSAHEVVIAPIVHTCVCADRTIALRSAQRHLASYAASPSIAIGSIITYAAPACSNASICLMQSCGEPMTAASSINRSEIAAAAPSISPL
jgi:alkanesulfonate monooxygenase SsuD/methylene tetrahydromethanopterin reductase-like flavin-dependent oxidoreductase (luciferase family)